MEYLPPDASSLLDINSSTNNKGLLIPRVALTATNAAAPITTPANSLMVYNTATAGVSPNNVTPGYYYWNGTKWIAFGGSGGTDWSLTGNAGTTAGTNFLGTTDTKDLVFKTNGVENMRILNSNGKVGIGTASPVTKLHLFGGDIYVQNPNTSQSVTVSQDGGIELYRSTIGTVANVNGFIDFKDSETDDSDFRIYYTNPSSVGTKGALVFASTTNGQVTTALTRMVIKNDNGNVGIGTITPAQKLDVNGNIAVSGATVHTSDIRYKKNISTLNNSLANVLKLRGVNYQWRIKEFPEKNFEKRKQIGVIAQEIEKIYPQLVYTDSKGYKSVDYSHLTPILIEAIKELNAKNEQQQQLIESLKVENTVILNEVKSLKTATNNRLKLLEEYLKTVQKQ